MKESTKKLLKAIACMAGCAAVSGAAGKGMEFAKDKIINGGRDTEPDYTPTEEQAAELAAVCPEAKTEEEIIEEIIESTEEVEEEKEG